MKEPTQDKGPPLILLNKKNGQVIIDFRKIEVDLFIFDLDGVLTSERVKSFPKRILFKGFLPDDKLMGNVSSTSKDWISEAWNLGVNTSDPKVVKEISDRMDSHSLILSGDDDLYDWVHPTFRQLAAAKKLVGICTNNSLNSVYRALDGLGQIVSLVKACDNMLECRLKPYPDGILTICERLGVLPGKAMVIGDSMEDGRAAERAGTKWLIVKGEDLYLKY